MRDPASSLSELRRPHHCIVTWGESGVGRHAGARDLHVKLKEVHRMEGPKRDKR